MNVQQIELQLRQQVLLAAHEVLKAWAKLPDEKMPPIDDVMCALSLALTNYEED